MAKSSSKSGKSKRSSTHSGTHSGTKKSRSPSKKSSQSSARSRRSTSMAASQQRRAGAVRARGRVSVAVTPPRRATRQPAKSVIGKGVRVLSGLLSSLTPESMGSYLSEIEGRISNERLAEYLSEFIAMEQSSVRIYSDALNRARSPEIRNQLGIFLDQARHHTEVLEGVIRHIGFDPSFSSQSAEIERRRFESISQTHAPERLEPIVDMENLFLAKTLCHFNWELLRGMIPFVDDARVRGFIERAVDEIGDEEDDHVHWLRRQLARFTVLELVGPSDQQRQVESLQVA